MSNFLFKSALITIFHFKPTIKVDWRATVAVLDWNISSTCLIMIHDNVFTSVFILTIKDMAPLRPTMLNRRFNTESWHEIEKPCKDHNQQAIWWANIFKAANNYDLTTISSSTLNTTCMVNKLFQVSAAGQLSNWNPDWNKVKERIWSTFVKLRQGTGKERQGWRTVKGLKA